MWSKQLYMILLEWRPIDVEISWVYCLDMCWQQLKLTRSAAISNAVTENLIEISIISRNLDRIKSNFAFNAVIIDVLTGFSVRWSASLGTRWGSLCAGLRSAEMFQSTVFHSVPVLQFRRKHHWNIYSTDCILRSNVLRYWTQCNRKKCHFFLTDRLIFDMGMPIPGKDGLYIESSGLRMMSASFGSSPAYLN